jgi:hypothetical protein
VCGVVDCVDHPASAIGSAEGALGGALGAVPEQQVGAFLFAETAYDVGVEIGPDGTGEAQRFVVGEDRGFEGVPRVVILCTK